ncbi:MAG: hypothetical protein Q8S73_34200 [Deltaproteobacteria bacterium]|nr:hypothetical protein [Deltaproteobacteria bacterium]
MNWEPRNECSGVRAELVKVRQQRDEALARCVRIERELDRANGFHERLAGQRDELLAALGFILRGMDGGHIKCAAYFDFDPAAEQLEFQHPADMIRAVIAKAKPA